MNPTAATDPRARTARPALIAAILLTAAVLTGALGAATARASTEVLVTEPFTGSTMSSSNWVLPSAPTGSNEACLTAGTSTTQTPVPGCGLSTPDASGSGALRLTSAATTQEGGVAYSLSVPTADGIDATFNTHQYGSSSRADGIAFFLAAANPADPVPPASIGESGGALGYSTSGGNAGMTYGYLGIGLDVYGNYANSTVDGSGCTSPGWRTSGTAYANNVSVRGPGDGTTGYCLLNSTRATNSMSGKVLDASSGTRASSTVPVEVVINPSASSITTASGLTVAAQSYEVAFTPVGSAQQTLSGSLPSVAGLGFPSSWYNASTGIPYQLTFGWVGSTGGSTEIHEVDNLSAATVAGTPPALTASMTDDASGTPVHGSTINYSVAVGNQAATADDPGPITVTDTLPTGETPGSASGTGWSCTAPSGQTVTCTYTGTLATGASLNAIDFPATVTAGAGTALTNTAVASSDTSNPARAQDAVTVATPPSVVANPTFTLANVDGYTGSATGTQGTYGGTAPLTITDTWQHCNIAGTSCTDISGATGLSYATGPADYGYRLRLHEHVSNVAGSVDAYSTYIAGVPSTTLTSVPSDPSNSSVASITASSAAGAAFLCTLDSGAAGDCASTAQFTGLSDGDHTLTVQAVYAGLSDPTGASDTWLVDTTPPTDTSSCGAPTGQNGTYLMSDSCTVQGTDAGSGVDHVAYRLDSGPIVTTVSGTTTATVPITGDGTHQFSTEIVDAAGNTSGWTTHTITVDTPPPAPTVTSPANGSYTNDNEPTITVSAQSGSTVAIDVDGALAGTPTADGDGHASITLSSPLSDGAHTVDAIATDQDGNSSPDSATNTFTVITVAPPAPTVTAPADGAYTNDNEPTITVSAQPYSTDTIDIDGTDVGTATADAGGTASLPLTTPLSDGAHTVDATATDRAGNLSPDSATNTFTVITVAPPAPTVTAPADGSYTNDNEPTITVSAQPHSAVAVYVDGALAGTATADAGGAASLTLTTPLSDGQHTVDATATDRAGNLSPDSTTNTFTVITVTPPAPTITAPADGSSTNDTTPTVTVSAQPYSTDMIDIDGTEAGTATADAGGAASLTLTTPLSDGQHTVDATATDRAGNRSPASATNTFTVKTVTSVHLTGPSAGPTATADPTVTYTGEPGDEFSLSVDGTVAATGVIPAAGAGSLTLPAALADGPHTIAISATDALGNIAADSVVITVDTHVPSAVSIVQAPAHDTALTSAAFEFTGAGSGEDYQCSLDGGPYAPCDPAVTFSGLAEGPHILLVRLVSGVGIPGAGTEYAWTVDTAPPPAPPVLTAPATATTPGDAHFSFSPEPGATLECSLDGGSYAPCPQSLTLTGLSLGTHTLKVVQLADTGQMSVPTVYRWRVLRRTGPRGLARWAQARIAARSTAYGGDRLLVGCALNAGSVHTCTVNAYWHDQRIGSGTARVARAGALSTAVTVMLTAKGRALLARAIGGLPIALWASATPFHQAQLPAGVLTVAYAPFEFVLPDVLFASASSQLTSRASAIVSQMAAELRGARSIRCEGDTDDLGGAAYNLELGMQRARTVCDALRDHGVHADFSLVSFGPSRPVASNATAAGRRLNRRVVVQASFLDLAPARPAHRDR